MSYHTYYDGVSNNAQLTLGFPDSCDSQSTGDSFLAHELSKCADVSVIRHFFGFLLLGTPPNLNDAAMVCLNASWWQHVPCLTTELGIAELMIKGISPTIHAENVLSGMRVAHARIIPNAHLLNQYNNAGDPEAFGFGTTKFVTLDKAKEILINTFVRPRFAEDNSNVRQPIILVGHAVQNMLTHITDAFDLNLLGLGTIVKVVDTQSLAKDAFIHSSRGPNISLPHLLDYFKLRIPNLKNAGNEAAGTLIAAVLTSLRDDVYLFGTPQAVVVSRDIQDVVAHVMAQGKSSASPPWGKTEFCTRCDRDNHVRAECRAMVKCEVCEYSNVVKLFKARKTHKTHRCLYKYLELPPRDSFSR